MPNHVSCRLTLQGPWSAQKEFLDRCRTDEQEFSFAGIRPRPEGVDWYSWNVENWGTKCAYTIRLDVEEGREYNTIRFQTAWACPEPWFRAALQEHPDIAATLAYADEDWGRNQGMLCNELYMAQILPDEAVPVRPGDWGYEETGDYDEEKLELWRSSSAAPAGAHAEGEALARALED